MKGAIEQKLKVKGLGYHIQLSFKIFLNGGYDV